MFRRLIFFCFLPITLPAQAPYFQQEVRYTIRATLNDRDHTLDGHIRMEYVNHSPDTLPEIRMHLWANAYKNRQTAFCRQKLRDGNARFYFAPEEQLGYFKNIDFVAGGQKVNWRIDKKNPDIAVLQLAQPLAPGGEILIETPFFLKIPASFSRLGHVGTSYQMTQWYPKPAVYDRLGWHDMPYLDVGEFYSEFGSFDVTITLPENYVVGATGALQTPSEIVFLHQKEVETRREMARRAAMPPAKKQKNASRDTFPPSAAAIKTLRYTASGIHDFAWFADKRFFVLKDTARLAGGGSVDCWAMFTGADFDLWQKGAFYVRRAVEFYSQHVGKYPWPHATAVHSALSAGGGMEYPMITVIGNESSGKGLDNVITHEVGHNWFYGILASNERDHAWMDEGLNSYYEHRYMMQYYGSDGMDGMLPRWVFNPAQSGPVRENAYLMLAREGEDTPPDTPAGAFWLITYGVQVYMKTAMCMKWLERSLGTARFDQAMQAYYQRWKFRHPYPDDLLESWRGAGVAADWFFQAMQTQRRFDMALTKVATNADSVRLTVKNRGGLAAPYNITALRAGKPVQTFWYATPVNRTEIVACPNLDADAFVLDYEHTTLDVNRKNNTRRTGGLFPGLEPPQLRFLAPVQTPDKSVLGILPWLGWNYYDKTMLGVLLYNSPFPHRRFQYFLLPGFGLGSKRFTGLADVQYSFLAGSVARKVTLGFNAKLFDYDYNWPNEYYLQFFRLAPRLRLDLGSGSPAFSHFLQYRPLFIGKQEARFDADGFQEINWHKTTIHELRYEAARRSLPNPFKLSATLEQQNYSTPENLPAHYWRGALEWRQQFYYKAKRKITARWFAGGFLANSQRRRGSLATNSLSDDIARASFALNPQGFNDYRFDQIFLGRSESTGLLSRQVSQTEGGFKNAFGVPFAGIANSNNFILSLNLKADLPQRLPLGIPLRPYFDIGYFDDATPLGENRPFNEQLLWSGGLMLEFLNGGFEIYFPLINAPALRDRYSELAGKNYFRRISWSIRLSKVTPMEVVRNLAN